MATVRKNSGLRIEPSVETGADESELVVEGASELRVVEDYFGLDLPGKPTDTVSLWILNHTEIIPQASESFLIDGLEVRIDEASPRCIDRVSIRRAATGNAAQDTDRQG